MMKKTNIQKVNWMIYKSPLRLLIIVAISIYIAEAVVMAMINSLQHVIKFSELAEVFLDPLMLVLLLSPLLFFFFFRPLLLHIKERKLAEDALRESEKHLHDLSSRLLTIQEQERMRISRELHDELGQSLTLLKLRLRFIEKELSEDRIMLREECENVLDYTDQVIENIRRISRNLSPIILEDCGLTAALKRMVKDFVKHHNIEVFLDVDDIDHLFPQEDRIGLYRILQESLTNICKHSGATVVNAALKEKGERFFCLIEDNGRGFNLNGDHATKGLGLATMKERVRILGGFLDLWSHEGKGTRISFSVPVREEVIRHERISYCSR